MARTKRPYVNAIGSSRSAPPRKPSIAPPGPPRPSQSSMMTSQPTPTMLPKPNVKYSSAPRVRRRLVGGNSKLFLQRGEELLGAQLTRRAGWRRELEIARRARWILGGAEHRLNRHARFPRRVRIGPEPELVCPRELSRLEPGVGHTDETDRNGITDEQCSRGFRYHSGRRVDHGVQRLGDGSEGRARRGRRAGQGQERARRDRLHLVGVRRSLGSILAFLVRVPGGPVLDLGLERLGRN